MMKRINVYCIDENSKNCLGMTNGIKYTNPPPPLLFYLYVVSVSEAKEKYSHGSLYIHNYT